MKLENKRAAAYYIAAALLAVLGYFGLPLLLRGIELTLIAYYLINAVQQVLLFALPALLIMRAHTDRWQRFRSQLRPLTVDTTGYCMLGAVACTVVASLVVSFWVPVVESVLGYVPENPPLLHPENAGQWIGAIIAVAVVPAMAEELFFRGFLQTAVGKFFPRAAVYMVAAVFAALHLEIVSLPGLFLVGLLLGKLKEKRGLWASVLFHALYNCVALLLNFKGAAINLMAVWLCLVAFIYAVKRLMREEENHAADGTGL